MRVTLLTTPECRLCDHAKQVLDRVAVDHDLTVETVSIQTERGHELTVKHKLAFPPGVLLDDRPFSYGRLSERKLRRELERIGATRLRVANDTSSEL
ncbi:MAG: glutaredoxin family protein [Acidimicrobiales bacterium]